MEIISQSILPFLAMLVLLIVVHEIGHFVTAKLAGVKVLASGRGIFLRTDWVSLAEPLMLPLVTVKV